MSGITPARHTDHAMLTHLHIRDFAIIDELELDLNGGMTALTGETGAGKSILIDALGLALGDRADSGVVRHGRERADVSASFDIAALPDLQAWLEEQGLDAGGECGARRRITAEGRSRGFVNGNSVPMQTLQQLGAWLVDIHGQHEHQSLLRRDVQRQLLDDYAGHGPLLNELAACFQQWQMLDQKLDQLRTAAESRDARLDLLRYQVQELDALAAGAGEIGQLEEEHARLHHTQRLLDSAERSLQQLYDDDGAVISILTQRSAELEQVLRYDARLGAPLQLMREAVIQLDEAVAALRGYVANADLDPARLGAVEERLSTLHAVARIHRVVPEALPALHAGLTAELAELENSEVHLEKLAADLKLSAQRYRMLAQQLSEGRARAARDLATEVSTRLQDLGMPGGQFAIALEPRRPDDYAATGMEQVEFQVSANPGQPLRPLTKVASGGELSRISLAIQVVTSRCLRVPTLVFDEVDVGIGGGVAEIVGKQLRALGAAHQVLCITHLPQVAALAHHHLQVRKQTQGEAAARPFLPLSGTARYEEIARMLGGVEITKQTRAHAREMVTRAQQPRNTREFQ